MESTPKAAISTLSHKPPYGVLDMAMRFEHKPIGNRHLSACLSGRDNQTLCICGHANPVTFFDEGTQYLALPAGNELMVFCAD